MILGNFDHALPIGCMRVFMIPSCRSDVMWLRRCNGAVNSLSSWPRASCSRRSEEHTSELQSLMRISYAVFCLKKKKKKESSRNNNEYTRNYSKNYRHIKQ